MEAIESERYMNDTFNGWIELVEGEHEKENRSVIGEGKDVKIRGEEGGEVVKLVGEIEGDGEGILCGRTRVGLSIEGITMKEKDGDVMNVPLIVWSGGYVVMSDIKIIRIGSGRGRGGGRSDVVMKVSESRGSEITNSSIRYDWTNSLIREREMKNEAEESICEWNESIIVLKNNSKFGMKRCELNGSRNGGISVNGGDVSLNDCVFDGTAEEKEGFESIKHNVICSNEGSIMMNGYNGERIKKNTSLWIMIGDCVFETSEEQSESLLYVPILKGVRYDNSTSVLCFYGSMMIGCNMSYEISYSNGNPFTFTPVSLSGVEGERESEISVLHNSVLSSAESYTAHLIYGENKATEVKRIVWPGEEYEEGGSGESGGGRGGGRGGNKVEGGGKNRMAVWIVIVVVMIIVVVMVVGVIVMCMCVWTRKGREKEMGGKEEMREVIDSLLSYPGGEGGETEEAKMNWMISTDSSLSSTLSSLSTLSSGSSGRSSNNSSRSGRGEEEEEEEEEEEGSGRSEDENRENSSRYLYETSMNGTFTTMSEGKSMKVSSDVQWPLSEGMDGGSGRGKRGRWG